MKGKCEDSWLGRQVEGVWARAAVGWKVRVKCPDGGWGSKMKSRCEAEGRA